MDGIGLRMIKKKIQQFLQDVFTSQLQVFMEENCTQQEAAESTEVLKIAQRLKDSVKTGTFNYSLCYQLKTWWLSKGWQACLLYSISTGEETTIGYSDKYGKEGLAKSIPQTVKCYEAEQVQNAIISQDDHRQLIILIKIQKPKMNALDQKEGSCFEWKLRFESEQLAKNWMRKILKLKAQKNRSIGNNLRLLTLVNQNLQIKAALSSEKQYARQNWSQFSTNSYDWSHIIRQFRFDIPRMVEIFEERLENRIKEVRQEQERVWSNRNTILHQEFYDLRRQNLALNKEVQKLEFSNRRLQIQLIQTKQNLQIEVGILRSEKQNLQTRLAEENQRIDKLQADSNETNRVFQRLMISLSEAKQEKVKITEELDQKFKTLIRAQQSIIQKENELILIQSRYDALNQNFIVLEAQFKNLKNQSETTQRELDLVIDQLNVSKAKQNQLRRHFQHQQHINVTKSQQIQKLESRVNQLRHNLQNMERQKAQKDQKLTSYEEKILFERQMRLFDGDILSYNQCDKKIFMLSAIQHYTNRRIEHTKRIYFVDEHNPTNFHAYIDDKQNICFLIKIKNGHVIAGFSQSPISSKQLASRGGLIMSVTNRKSFQLMQGKKSVTYDSFFIIVGNSELRLKHGQKKFFTNFGIANSFYAANGEKHTILTGEGTEKEVQLDTFEVFKLEFRH